MKSNDRVEHLPRTVANLRACGAVPAARMLLGWRIVRVMPDGSRLVARIVETEAYPPGDPASHAYRGLTRRNGAMFEAPGTAYVYLIYGMYWCLNVVTGPSGAGEAVLIRGLDGVEGCDGPGKLCRSLDVDDRFDGARLLSRTGDLRLMVPSEDPREPTVVTTRIGLTKAADRPLRFYLAGSPGVSRRDRVAESLVRVDDRRVQPGAPRSIRYRSEPAAD
ncbi:MAG TPA: DNA-3-methyladenine glycosylase [Blastocatellia bacterium]|nr:DNA-3-methyladenine glycosylase [Blastocatellia bacterium]